MTYYKNVIPFVAIACAATLSSCAPSATADQASYQMPQLTQKQQAKLDRKLSGRVAGEPVSCISPYRNTDYTAVSDDILIYEVGTTVYVNQPYGGCKGAENHALVSTRPTTQICSGEIAEVRDTVSGFSYGSCSLGKFTPYRKVDSSAD